MDRKKTLGVRLTKRKRNLTDPGSEDVRVFDENVPGPSRERTSPKSEDRPAKKTRHFSFGEQDVAGDSGLGSSTFLVPGFNYLGPLNPLDNGPPTNRVDQAAREHDFAYAAAERRFDATGNSEEAHENIKQADQSFLEDLSQIEPESYTEAFGKFVGQVGIGAKKTVEGLLHSTLYPHFDKGDMDVVDASNTVSNATFVDNSASPMKSMLNLGNGIRKGNDISWNFQKTFQLGFKGQQTEYKKTNASQSVMQGMTEIKTYIHSLPWEKLYFYLTEREYNTITNGFHTAKVEYIKIKIYNLGVCNPVLNQKDIAYKVFNPNSYLGVWRGFEKHGPVTLGNEITPKVLYGSSLLKLDEKSMFGSIDVNSLGAITETKYVDNRVTYNKVTSRWKQNSKKDIDEAEIFLPPLMDMASLTLNANSHIGLIYETVYKPNDGLFHNKSFAFHNAAVVQHSPFEQNIDLADQGKMSDATYIITDSVINNKPMLSYENATIDNMFFRSLRGNPTLSFIDTLGVGLFPKRDPSNQLIDSTLELSIQTEIGISAQAFGGSVLSGGKAEFPQSNPNNIYFIHKRKKFGNAYASDSLPTLENS